MQLAFDLLVRGSRESGDFNNLPGIPSIEKAMKRIEEGSSIDAVIDKAIEAIKTSPKELQKREREIGNV